MVNKTREITAGDLAGLMDMDLLQPEMAGRRLGIKGCYIGDLLSNVMGNAKSGQLWLTVITNINTVAIAQLLELAGIVLLEGNPPAEGVLERATMEDIPVFSSKDTAFQAAVKLVERDIAKP